MTIEKLKSSDLAQYRNLIFECFDGSNSLETYTQNYDESSQNYDIVVAKDNNIIIGAATLYKIDLFTFSFQPCLELFNVCVAKDYRRNNVARELLEYIIIFAKNNEYKSIILNCLSDALPAQKLYESVGFKQTGSLKYILPL
jgi:ribosomal protein S18 acetylase RimI-like enzyme